MNAMNLSTVNWIRVNRSHLADAVLVGTLLVGSLWGGAPLLVIALTLGTMFGLRPHFPRQTAWQKGAAAIAFSALALLGMVLCRATGADCASTLIAGLFMVFFGGYLSETQ